MPVTGMTYRLGWTWLAMIARTSRPAGRLALLISHVDDDLQMDGTGKIWLARSGKPERFIWSRRLDYVSHCRAFRLATRIDPVSSLLDRQDRQVMQRIVKRVVNNALDDPRFGYLLFLHYLSFWIRQLGGSPAWKTVLAGWKDGNQEQVRLIRQAWDEAYQQAQATVILAGNRWQPRVYGLDLVEKTISCHDLLESTAALGFFHGTSRRPVPAAIRSCLGGGG